MRVKPETLVNGPTVPQVLQDPTARWVLYLWGVAFVGACLTLVLGEWHASWQEGVRGGTMAASHTSPAGRAPFKHCRASLA